MGGLVGGLFSDNDYEPIYIEKESSDDSEGKDDKKVRRRANLSAYSNINTSHKGILQELEDKTTRKTLLGE